MENSIEIKNLTKKYDGFLLDNISLSLPKGCIMGFIGENGAGKSTTIKLLLDIIKKDSGEVKILGLDANTDLTEIKQNIGIVFDESNFPDNVKPSNVNSIMKNIYREWNSDTFNSYIKKFDIPTMKTVKEFSRGMKMKLSIAVALSHNAKLLILDEATSGLDPIIRDEILDIFLEFIQNDEHSIFVSSHITSDLEKIADYITFIHKGKILLSEPKDDLLYNYGILKLSNEEYSAIDQALIIGCRKNQFSVDALVLKKNFSDKYVIDNASLEDIMLFHVKGVK